VAHAALLDSGLPTLGLPDVTLHDYGDLARGRRGLMLVGFAEGLDAAKTYAARDQYDIDANRELIGLGGANLASGLSSGMVVNGSLSKTAVNGSAGAHTQLAGLVVAVLTIVTLLILTGLFESLPEATVAAIVIVSPGCTGSTPAPSRLLARPDFVAALAAMLGVLIFDTLPGLFIGIGVSMLRRALPTVA
jgi:SulP family sulfate permease